MIIARAMIPMAIGINFSYKSGYLRFDGVLFCFSSLVSIPYPFILKFGNFPMMAEQSRIFKDNLSITEQLHTLLILPQYIDGF